MKAKNILIIGSIVAAVLYAGPTAVLGGGIQNPPPGKQKGPPPKPTKPPKPVVKPPKPRPTLYSGRALGVNLSNVVNGAVWHLADTGPLRPCGGSIELAIGATNMDMLSVGGAHVVTFGVGGVADSRAEVQNFSAVFVHLGITNVIAFTSASAEARAECTAIGVVLTASSQVQGLTIDGTNVLVTGEANQVITVAAGNIVLNAQISSLATNCQQGEVTVAAVFLMLTNCFHGPIAYAEADIRCGSKVPPSVRACDKVTGGGFILGTPSGGHGSFAVGGGIRRGEFWGHLNYIDHDTGMHVHASAVTGYTVIDSVTRQIDYNVDIDGAAGTARVIVADNGEPGRDDIFDITLSTGYHAGGDLGGSGHGGGNIQLHKCPPGWAK